MSVSDLEALQDVQECSGGPTRWSEGQPGCPGVVGRPFRMSRSGREILPDVREVGKTSRMSGSGRKALPGGREANPDVREW